MTSHSGAGGAAAHAGVDFQQRLTAWFAAAMLANLDVSTVLSIPDPLYIEQISMETASSVDDLVLTSEDGRKIFIQAKTSPILSSDPDSEFGKAVKQFVDQHRLATNSRDLYVLAIAPTASRKIREQLRKLLLAIRYDATAWKTVPLSESEREILDTFLMLLRQFSRETEGREWTEEQLVGFARSVYIATFDLDDSGSDCRSAFILLHALTRLKSPADLVWSRLIQLCLDASKRRLQISKEGLRTSLSRFIEDAATETEATAVFEIIQTGSGTTGKEVVLVEKPEFGNNLLLFELQRFDQQGQRHIKFAKGKCIIRGSEYDLLHRTATIAGMKRFVQKNAQAYAGRRLIVEVATFDKNPDLGGAARARAEWIKNRLQQVLHELRCLYCGRAVSASVAAVVELDDEDHAPDAGIVHERCLQPMHRVLGQMTNQFFEDNRHIIDFDVNLWVKKLRRGQGLLAGWREAGSPPGVRIAWNPDPVEMNLRYCVRVQLADGSRPPVLRRGKVHRFSLRQAKRIVADLTTQIQESVRVGNPFCMSEDGRVFGPRSQLVTILSHEIVSECKAAQVVPYSRDIGEKYDQHVSYYAPLIAIRVGDGEECFRIDDACVLLSDLLRVEEHFINWAAAGIIFADYSLEIIADDAAFDILMRENVAGGYHAVIDPMLAPDGTEMSGIPVFPLVSMHL